MLSQIKTLTLALAVLPLGCGKSYDSRVHRQELLPKTFKDSLKRAPSRGAFALAGDPMNLSGYIVSIENLSYNYDPPPPDEEFALVMNYRWVILDNLNRPLGNIEQAGFYVVDECIKGCATYGLTETPVNGSPGGALAVGDYINGDGEDYYGDSSVMLPCDSVDSAPTPSDFTLKRSVFTDAVIGATAFFDYDLYIVSHPAEDPSAANRSLDIILETEDALGRAMTVDLEAPLPATPHSFSSQQVGTKWVMEYSQEDLATGYFELNFKVTNTDGAVAYASKQVIVLQAGDANVDGCADSADQTIIQANLGTIDLDPLAGELGSWSLGDMDMDGDVDSTDEDIWLDHDTECNGPSVTF